MPTSYNGWSASPSLPLRPLVVAGEAFSPGVRDDDDVYTVLAYVAQQMHERVEPIVRNDWHQADDWGFSYRTNRNSTNLSNHASGTAIDYNATRHPNGVPARNTFTDDQIRELHQILAEVDNTVRWGGDYTGTPDAMHFEINADKTRVAAAARTLRDKPNLPPVAGIPGWRVKAARDFGLANAEAAAVAATRAGLPYWAACALLEKESGGRNIFGHDKGGAGPAGEPVTKARFQDFYAKVLNGATSNGVGPCQITYAGGLVNGKRDGGYFRIMLAQNLKPWDVEDNMFFGFNLLREHYTGAGDSWTKAGTAYNGAAAYGIDLLAKIHQWRARLEIKADLNPRLPAPKDETPPPPEVPTQPLGPANLTTGTFNLGGGPTEAKIGDLLRLLKTCDIIGLQEAGDRQDVFKQLEAAGFLVDQGDDTPGASSVPIVVNETRIEAVRGYTLELAPRMVTRGWPESLRRTVAKVSRKPAGPKWVKRKVLNVVVLEHPDGRRIHFANTHLPASIWHPGRRAIAAKCVAAIVKAEGEIPSQVIISADWNAKAGHPVLKPIKAAGLRLTQAAQKVATHGRRGIDGFAWRQTSGLQFVDQRAVKTSSDHKAVIARWHVSKR